ncbi:MAG: hypothetical protein WC547_01345 [Candidatus Omnitrophota bacterium]
MGQRGQTQQLILNAIDASAYIITGDLFDPLQKIAQQKTGINLVTITGVRSRSSSLTCERSTKYENKDDGTREQITDVVCIPYFYLDARAIVSVAESDQPMPPAKRDAAAESSMISRASQTNIAPPAIGEIYGTITACNFKASVKTIEVRNRDSQSPMKSITLLITSDTRVVKRIGKSEPAGISPDTLNAGQHVTVIYSLSEERTNALFITVTKE